MKRTGFYRALGVAGAILLAGCGSRFAQTGPETQTPQSPATLRVEGDLTTPEDIPLESLKSRASQEFDWSHEGKSNRYRGIPLVSLFEERGIDPGPGGDATPQKVKHPGLKLVIVATSPDGYQAVFSYAELSSAMGPTKAWLVWEMDGQPLPAPMAPLRILVPTDAGADRCIYQVSRLTVVDLRKVVPADGGVR